MSWFIATLTSDRDLLLSGLALVLSIALCPLALVMLFRAMASRGRPRLAWLLAAATAFGTGIWGLALLSHVLFTAATPLAAAPALLGLALVEAVTGALGAFSLWSRSRGQPSFVMLGGAMVALAVVAMHYTGLAAAPSPLAVAAGGDSALSSFVQIVIVLGGVALLILLLGIVVTLVDVRFVLRRAEEAQRLRQLADSAFEGLLIHRDGNILDANTSLTSIVGLPREALIGGHVLDFVALSSHSLIRERLATKPSRLDEFEIVLPDGTRRVAEVLSRPILHGGRPATVAAIRDISERKQAAARIEHLARHDPLTSLPNRATFNALLRDILARAEESGAFVGLLVLDIDRFTFVNGLYGHDIGDTLLRIVARRLASLVRQDTHDQGQVARLGGDEFAIALPPGRQASVVVTMAEALQAALAEPIEIANQSVQISARIGIAFAPQHGKTVAALMNSADTALFWAKRDERAKIRIFEPAMESELQVRRRLERNLRLAVQNQTFKVHYQPIYAVDGRTLVGFEALLRWFQKDLGWTAPSRFIPLAEESGMIGPLGRLVLETACAEAAGWPAALQIAVNLSPIQFRTDDLVATVTEILARTKLAPERLELELTEGVLIDDTERARAQLVALKALGVRLVLDDFGTGYSSLSYLGRFPFDKLKIDRSFVSGLASDAGAEAIVRAISALAHGLGLAVTAEGVETMTQLDLLRAVQCTELQGFLLGRPMPASAAARLIRQQRKATSSAA